MVPFWVYLAYTRNRDGSGWEWQTMRGEIREASSMIAELEELWVSLTNPHSICWKSKEGFAYLDGEGFSTIVRIKGLVYGLGFSLNSYHRYLHSLNLSSLWFPWFLLFICLFGYFGFLFFLTFSCWFLKKKKKKLLAAGYGVVCAWVSHF